MQTKEQDELSARLNRLEKAVFGDPLDPNQSIAILPTMQRLSNYMDAACWAWRAAIAAVGVSASTFAFDRGLGWW